MVNRSGVTVSSAVALALALVEAAPITAGTCPACSPSEQLVDHAIGTTELFSACATLTAGPSFRVAPTGRVTLLSGGTIALQNGARVDALGELVLDAGPHVVPPEVTSGPTLTLPANPAAPLAGLVELTTDVESFLELGFDAGGDTWTADLGGPLTTHAAPALGFKPDTAYLVSATVTGENELACTPAPMADATAPLPADFPSFTVTSTPVAMEPGVTMFDVAAGTSGNLVIVDEVGDVLWFWSNGLRIGDARRLANGNLLLMNTLTTRTTAHEIDMLGNVVQTWHANAFKMDAAPGSGNVLFNCGFIFPPVEGAASASITEVTHTTPAVEVFKLLVDDDNASGPPNRTIYRTERLPSLYP